MTQIVETRPFPETFPPGQPQDRPAPTSDHTEADAGEEVRLFTAPPQIPWPRVFPGL